VLHNVCLETDWADSFNAQTRKGHVKATFTESTLGKHSETSTVADKRNQKQGRQYIYLLRHRTRITND